MHVHDLPHLNALLNATSALLVAAGVIAIRQRRVSLHRRLMLGAVIASAAFLASYLYYHAQVGSVRFGGVGPIRMVYFTILITHSVLAAALPCLVPVTVGLALKGRLQAHRRWAKVTMPVWLYVSMTGVVVYWMLYRL